MTILKDVRDALDLRPGVRLELRVLADGSVSLRPLPRSISEVVGSLAAKIPEGVASMTFEEMDEALAESFRREYAPRVP